MTPADVIAALIKALDGDSTAGAALADMAEEQGQAEAGRKLRALLAVTGRRLDPQRDGPLSAQPNHALPGDVVRALWKCPDLSAEVRLVSLSYNRSTEHAARPCVIGPERITAHEGLDAPEFVPDYFDDEPTRAVICIR
jgi:hypothetical protein